MSELLESGTLSDKNEPSGELLHKLQAIDQELREETGGVVLFGLFERDDSPGRWDVLVAADWVVPHVTPAVAYVARKIQQRLTPAELESLSGVVALPSSDPSVRHLLAGTLRVHGRTLVEQCTFNGVRVTRAWIFTADLDNRSLFQPPPYVAPQPASAGAKITKSQKAAARSKSTHRKR
jgi:hypothetical protein